MAIFRDHLNLIICGVGGQGNVVISRLIGKALVKKSYFVSVSETFGAAQRGGAVTSDIMISKKEPYGLRIPRGRADIILGLEPMETLRSLIAYGNPEVVTITNSHALPPVDVIMGQFEYPSFLEINKAIQRLSRLSWVIDATHLATELGAPVMANVVMVGALFAYKELPFTPQDIEDTIKETFPPDRIELNLKAFEKGLGIKEVRCSGKITS